jgi:uncharacterized protein YcfL
MNSNLKRGLAALGLAFAAMSAHAQTAQTPDYAVSPGIAAKMIVRGDLQGLQVIDLRSQKRGEVMVVQAEVVNNNPSDLRLYYRFRWTDGAGMQVGDGEVWKPVVFLGKQTQFLKGTAYGPQATDFKIEMSAEPRD